MKENSIKEIKQEIYSKISCSNIDAKFPIGLGRAKKGKENLLAIRIFGKKSYWRNKLSWFSKLTCGEMDVRFIDNVAILPPVNHRNDQHWNRQRVRPLRIGSSISHENVTAGTLGCFTQDKYNSIYILSNNHVLANQNVANLGDKIFQPGTYDGGTEADTVATLEKFIPIEGKNNLVDCAIAKINRDVKIDSGRLISDSLKLEGLLNQEFIQPGCKVVKFGRTTGITHGLITAVEVDKVAVHFNDGIKFFDQQIEIEGEGDHSFSAGGDSGSMVINDNGYETRYAIGLLFAGGSSGGSNGAGLTYVNYMSNVLKSLDVTIWC